MLFQTKSWVTHWYMVYSSLQPTLSAGPCCEAQWPSPVPQLPPLKHIYQ